MPFKTAVQARWNAVRSWRPDREKRWHYVFMLFSWACFIFACWRTWQVVYGRMYYLLDSDMSSELVLSHLLRQEHKIVTQDWFTLPSYGCSISIGPLPRCFSCLITG